MNERRRYAIFAPGHFANDAKTAHGVIRYGSDAIVAVVDPSCAGKRVRDVVGYLDCDAPIVATLTEALRFAPTSLMIGTAPVGGALPVDWRASILQASEARIEIVSGLHTMFADDPEFAAAARASGAKLWDVRRTPAVPIFSGEGYRVAAPILLTVGSDCAVGKMTVSIEIVRAAERAGVRSVFVPTGQTGIAIAGCGTAIDRVIADFAPGATEALVLEAARQTPDLIVVEGQGSINHPAYAPVTLALMYGAAPDALLLVCDPTRVTLEGFSTPTLSYRTLIRLYEALLATVKPARVVGIALNTHALSDERAREEIERARRETLLPADDVVRYGPDALYAAIAPQIEKRPCAA